MGAMNIDPSGEQYVVSYVGADEADVGRAAGKLMQKHLGSGTHKVAIVEGQAGTDPQIQRTKGFEEANRGKRH
jgi:ABC-type sugar transport system substrate-binding protein